MSVIAGLIMIGLVAWVLFAPPPKKPARCPTCQQLLPAPPKPKQKQEVGSILLLIVLIIFLAYAHYL